MCTTAPPAKSRKRQGDPVMELSHESGAHTQWAITGCTAMLTTACGARKQPWEREDAKSHVRCKTSMAAWSAGRQGNGWMR